MNRRLLLTSIATLAASPVLAQTNPSAAAGSPPPLSAARQKHIPYPPRGKSTSRIR